MTLRNLYDMNFAFSRFFLGYMICTRLSSSYALHASYNTNNVAMTINGNAGSNLPTNQPIAPPNIRENHSNIFSIVYNII